MAESELSWDKEHRRLYAVEAHMDGEITITRIRFESHGATMNLSQWSGLGGKAARRWRLPHQGYCKTAREASRMVEDYYHRLMRHNGLRGSKDV